MQDGADLYALLAEFALRMEAEDHTHERVSVDIVRRAGFQNDCVTTRGLRVLLDEPADFGGKGEAPDPAEYLLAAAGASLSVTLTAHAALRGLAIEHIRIGLAASIEARAFFHPGKGTPGLLDITIVLTVRSAAPRADVRALVDEVLPIVPVLASLKHPARVILKFEE